MPANPSAQSRASGPFWHGNPRTNPVIRPSTQRPNELTDENDMPSTQRPDELADENDNKNSHDDKNPPLLRNSIMNAPPIIIYTTYRSHAAFPLQKHVHAAHADIDPVARAAS